MRKEHILVHNIPTIVWGEPSSQVYLFVHGKMSNKEDAAGFASMAEEKGYQTISFDLPEHGERSEEDYEFHIFNAMKDLNIMADYVFARWNKVALYGCSIGAHFSLYTYLNRPFTKCLFQSPILDMKYLIEQMFNWFQITPELLEQQGAIETPIDTMRWDYYQYIQAHPVTRWEIPTCILYGDRDDLQSIRVVEDFARRFGCSLTVSEGSEHPFMKERDQEVVRNWLYTSMNL